MELGKFTLPHIKRQLVTQWKSGKNSNLGNRAKLTIRPSHCTTTTSQCLLRAELTGRREKLYHYTYSKFCQINRTGHLHYRHHPFNISNTFLKINQHQNVNWKPISHYLKLEKITTYNTLTTNPNFLK